MNHLRYFNESSIYIPEYLNKHITADVLQPILQDIIDDFALEDVQLSPAPDLDGRKYLDNEFFINLHFKLGQEEYDEHRADYFRELANIYAWNLKKIEKGGYIDELKGRLLDLNLEVKKVVAFKNCIHIEVENISKPLIDISKFPRFSGKYIKHKLSQIIGMD